MTADASLLPDVRDVIALGGVVVVVLLFAGLAGALLDPREAPDRGIVVGWGLACGVLTLGGIAGIPLAILLALLGAFALVSVRQLLRGPLDADAMMVIACLVPVLILAMGKQASEGDEFMHWLPNAAYLVDHDMFPGAGHPPSASVYPAFPYNLSFVALAVSRLVGWTAEQAVVLFNVVLAGVLANTILVQLRVSGATLHLGSRFGLAALATLLATLLNPTFVPKIVFTNYADFATGVSIAVAAWLVVHMVKALESSPAHYPWRTALCLGLVLAAIVNTKQANLVFVVLLAAGGIMVALPAGRSVPRRLFDLAPAWLGPAAATFLGWRWYVGAALGGDGENKIRAIADWQTDAIPDILAAMGNVFVRKGVYTALIVVVAAVAIHALVRRRQDPTRRLAQICLLLFVGYGGFLFFLYVAHFPGEAGRSAQSFWRYQTQLGPLAMVVLAGVVARWFDAAVLSRPARANALAAASIAMMLGAPLAFADRIRFDLEAPKPFLRAVVAELDGMLSADAIVIVHAPAAMAGEFEHYRYRLWRPERAVKVQYGPLLADGDYIWLYCLTAPLGRELGLPPSPGASILLKSEGPRYRVVHTWPHPTWQGKGAERLAEACDRP